MRTNLRISVSICTYNRAEFLYAALESLASQSLPYSQYEVILVDNNSTDETPGLAERFASEYPGVNFHHLLETNQGLSFARNRAIEESNSPVIAFIDDDAIASGDYLKSLVDFFDDYPEVMAAGGKILPYFYPHGERPEWMSHYLLGLISCIDLGDEIKPFPKYPIGCNMIFRQEVFEKIGKFDTRLGRTSRNLIGSEEKELFSRIKKTGMSVYYVPEAWVYHTIPEERIAMPFIRKMSIGVGQSERLLFNSGNLAGRIQILIRQSVKTAGTLVIALGYFLKGEMAKAKMLIQYRIWFWSGFFNPVTNG